MSVTLGNPDLIHGTGVGVLHYLRAVTSWLSLGAELAYQASPQLPGGHVAVVSAAARIAKVMKQINVEINSRVMYDIQLFCVISISSYFVYF